MVYTEQESEFKNQLPKMPLGLLQEHSSQLQQKQSGEGESE